MPIFRPTPAWSVLLRRISDDEPVVRRRHVGDVEPHELAAAHGPGEAEQDQRAVAGPQGRGGEVVDHGADVLGERRPHVRLGQAPLAEDAGPDEPDLGVPGRRLMALGPVGLGDRGEPAAERAGLQLARAVGQVAGHGLGLGGQRGAAIAFAPGGEVGPVGAVGPAGVGGLRAADELDGPRTDLTGQRRVVVRADRAGNNAVCELVLVRRHAPSRLRRQAITGRGDARGGKPCGPPERPPSNLR